MPKGPSRSWTEIDLGAISQNARTLLATASGAALCAVVKANAYGHGEIEAAQAAVAGGASILAVARVASGIRLRMAGFKEPIWILSEPAEDEFVDAARWRLEPAVYSSVGVRAAAAAGGRLTVHLKVDTGMHRVGAKPQMCLALAESIRNHETLSLGSLWTHCAVADQPNLPFTDAQLDVFEDTLAAIEDAGIDVPLTHAANSAATIAFPRARRDVVRCGIALYGLSPSAELAGRIPLEPALRWVSRVGFVKRLEPGDRVSYGQRTEVVRPCTAVTVPVGYADGYRRALWQQPGIVLVGGKRRNILGVVTMDQLVVDCGDDAVHVGDEVILLGQQGMASTTADDLAAALDTISYEIICGITERVGRTFTPNRERIAGGRAADAGQVVS